MKRYLLLAADNVGTDIGAAPFKTLEEAQEAMASELEKFRGEGGFGEIEESGEGASAYNGENLYY